MHNMRVCCSSIFNLAIIRSEIWTQDSIEELALANFPGLREAGPATLEEVASQLEHCVSSSVSASLCFPPFYCSRKALSLLSFASFSFG
jgi:hypothetical protein